jgi:hypothetical protein
MLPAATVALVALLMLSAGPGLEQRVAQPVRNEAAKQFNSMLQAEAGRLDERLCRASVLATALAAYAAAVLKAPAAYTPHAPAESAKPGVPPPKAVENPVYYPRGADGALRKPVDDGLSAAFYMARDGQRNFTEFEHQQLYATATLDPLLRNIILSDKLCDAAYIATKDGLMRIYPWANLQSWPGTRNPMAELTMCSYGKEKANAQGVVWTKPYESKLSGKWCIACVAPVIAEGKVVGVAGCEISADKLLHELLGDTETADRYVWLARPEGVILAAQNAAVAKLGITPVSDAALANTGNIQDKAFKAATVNGDGPTDVANAWAALDKAGGVKQVQTGASVVLVGKASLPASGFNLGAAYELPALTAIERYISGMRQAQVPALLALLGVIALGTLLAVLAAGLEARRITHSLGILTTQVRSVVDTGVTTAVVIDDHGELGDLSDAMQALIDITCIRAAEKASAVCAATPLETTVKPEPAPAPDVPAAPDQPEVPPPPAAVVEAAAEEPAAPKAQRSPKPHPPAIKPAPPDKPLLFDLPFQHERTGAPQDASGKIDSGTAQGPDTGVGENRSSEI